MSRRFNRFAQGSGVRGVLFYDRFIALLCEIYRIPSPAMVQTRWANQIWREIDVENSGSVTFESFYAWYVQHFDPVSGLVERFDIEPYSDFSTK